MSAGLTFTISTKVTGEFLKHPERTMAIFEKSFRPAINDSTEYIKRQTRERAPRLSGSLANSILSEVRGNGLNLQGVVGTTKVYSMPMEYGARPHFPPSGPIELWVRRRGISAVFKGVTLSIQQLAFIIARKISKKGLPAVHMFKNGFNASKGYVNKVFRTAQIKVISDLNK